MTQPTVKVLQIDQAELTAFVLALSGAGVTTLDQLTDVTLAGTISGEVLTYGGSPLAWRNTASASGITNIVGGDGITVTGGSPERTIDVDSTVARRNATNTFQQTNTYTAAVGGISTGALFQSAAPGYILDDTGGAADESIWRVYSSGGQLIYDTRNDANSVSVNWLTVDRTGTTVDAINFNGTALTFNGIPIHVGSPTPTIQGSTDNTFAGTNTFTKFWAAPGDGPIVLDSIGPTIEFSDTSSGDVALIELANTAFRFGVLSQGSPVGPGYDGLLTVGHSVFSPNTSLFLFEGYTADFSLTGGDFTVTTTGTAIFNSSVQVEDAEGTLQPAGVGVVINDSTTFDTVATHTPFQLANGTQAIYWVGTGASNFDTYTNVEASQTEIPDGTMWYVQCNGSGTLVIRGGTSVTIRYWAGTGAPADADVTVARGGVATVRKVSDTVYDVWGIGLS